MSTEDGNGRRSAAEIEDEARAARRQVERGIAELEHRFSPGQLMDQALDYIRHGNGAEFGRNLGRSVRDNPVPVALMGVGLAWLMLAGRREGEHGMRRDRDYGQYGPDLYEDDDGTYGAYGDDPDAEWLAGGSVLEPAAGPYGSVPSGQATETGDAAHGDGPGLGRRAASAAGSAAERARELGHGVGDRATRAAEAARHGADRAGSTATAAVARARSTVRDAGRRLRAGAAGTASQLRSQGERVRGGFVETLHEHPLLLGALGVAVGAAIGAALPATRREDELIGPQRDALKRRAGAYGRDKVEEARAAADRAYTAARDEARRQHLTPEAGREAVEDAAERVGSVATAAVEAARGEEAGRQGAQQSGPPKSP